MAKAVKIKDYKPKDKVIENAFEWITGERWATLTISEPKMMKRVSEIYKDRADEFKKFIKNDDGSVCVTLPKRWLKVNPGSKPNTDKPKRTMSEEQKKAFAERMAAVRAAKKEAKNEED